MKSSEEKDIVFNVYPLEHHRAQANSDGKCQREFICKNVSHDKYPTKKHVLVCHEHRGTTENEQLLLEYKNRCIMKQTKLAAFSRDLKLTFHMNQQQPSDYKHPQSNQESAIYILQTIKVNKKDNSLLFDTGCCDMVPRYAAMKSIGSRAKQESSIPISIGGVGNTEVKSNHGIFQVKLPLFNGSEATFSKVCLDQITVKFPQNPLKGIVEEDIAAGYKRQGNSSRDLPQLPQSVGGDTDFMLGIKYLRYYPEKVFQLPSGLTIYRSWFQNADGTRGVVGGPHKVFTEIESRYHMNTATFLSDQYKLFKAGYQVNPDASLLHVKVN